MNTAPRSPSSQAGRAQVGAILYGSAVVGVLAAVAWLPAPHGNGAPREDLLKAARDADRLVVREAGRVVIEVQDRAEVQAFLSFVDWRPLPGTASERHGGLSRCTIELFQGNHVLVRLDNRGGYALRWEDGPWRSDVVLTVPARRRLYHWFEEKGAPQLRPRSGDANP